MQPLIVSFAVVAVIGVVTAGVLAWLGPIRRWRERRELDRRRTEFLQQREHLEARFFERAAASRKPRGLRWKEIDFKSEVEFARDRKSGDLCALVSVEIAFEPIPGGPMEDVEAANDRKVAAAMFRAPSRGRWDTDGRAIFNLSPLQAIEHLRSEIVRLG
jgi:hypothetical protein